MKKNFWKKTAVGLMALLIVAGVSPVAPFSKTFEKTAVTASAALGEVVASGYCGMSTNEGGEESVAWTLTQNNEDEENPTYTLTISGTGAMADYDYNTTPWFNDRLKITRVTVEEGVTSIGNFAFYKFKNLTSLSIAGTVTSIGGRAFAVCASLTSINIPDSVTSIGESAFSQCTSLESLTIPESVTIIGRGVFNQDTNLTSLTYGGSAAEWAALTGDVELGIPEGCTMTYLKKDVAIDANISNGTVTADETSAAEDETVTLTVTPDEGYAVKSVKYNDTVIEPVEGVYSFTMPDEDVTVSAEFEQISVTYLDENGVEQTVVAASLESSLPKTGNDRYKIAPGWYVVDSNFTITKRIECSGDVHIILADGCTMNIGTSKNILDMNGVNSFNINIYGQSQGTGALNIYSSSNGINASGAFTINGGKINVQSSKGWAIIAQNASFINGGQIDAISSERGYYAVLVGADLTLGYSKATDYIHVSGMCCRSFTIAEGKTMTDGAIICTGGDSFTVEKTFIPANARSITLCDHDNGTMSVDKEKAFEGETVTLTVTPDEGYLFKSLSVKNGDDDVAVDEAPDGTYSFTMPAGNVTVSAEFAQIPVTYLDENGVEQTAVDYTVLTENEQVDEDGRIVLSGGTYVVNGTLDYSCPLHFSADNTVLILKDNAKLYISANGNAIHSQNLYIYGQNGGTGELKAEANSSCIRAADLYLYGGNITANSSNNDGIEAFGNIYLGGAEVTANSYKGTVQVKEGLIYGDTAGNIYTGTLTDAEKTAIAGKTLAPVKPQSLSSGTIASQPVLHIGNSDNILAIENTYLDGYKFGGFIVNGSEVPCMTMADVVSAVRTIRDNNHEAKITITPKFIQKTDTYTLNIVNGHLKGSTDTNGSFKASDQLYAVANEPEAGQKFECWKVGDTVVGYEKNYAFRMPSKGMTLTAVYVADTVEVKKEGVGYIENVYKPEDGKLSFVAILSVPEGCQMLKAGIVAQKKGEYTVELTEDNARFVRFTDTSADSYTSFKYTWTLTPSNADTEWTVRPYLVYTDAQGEHTIYGDPVEYSLNDLT